MVAFDQALDCIDERKRTPKITELIKAVDDFFTYSGQLSFSLPIYRIYPTKTWKKFVAASDIVYELVSLFNYIVFIIYNVESKIKLYLSIFKVL